MHLAGVRGACARELRYLNSHPWDWALISWVPVLVLAVIWGIFSAGVSTKLPLAFVDEDHSRSSRELARALDATRSTSLAAAPSDLPAAWSLLRAGRAYAVLHVPRDWERRVTRGEAQPVVLYTNEQFHAAGTSIANDVTGALLAVAGE